MKRFLVIAAVALVGLTLTGCTYDDSGIWDAFNDLKEQVEQNEEDIATLSALLDAQQNGKTITSTEYTTEGVVITFSDGTSVTIKNGKDGQNGTNGKDGADGKDGQNGTNGQDGKDGKDGQDGKDGKDGVDGKDGDSFFVSIEENETTVTITLADGRIITLPKATTEGGEDSGEGGEVVEPELGYELRVLTFEDADAKFDPYYLEYADGWSGREISKWSELIDSPQYSGPLMYGNDSMDAMYYWYDGGNTELYHMFPDNYAYCFWGGGHAVSNYWGAGYSDEDRNTYIAKYYGQDYLDQWVGVPGADGALGWFLLQLMTPCAPHSGDNFCVHYGYKDFFSYIENLPEWTFYDEEPRVIDHMWVTNTNYTLNQLYNGVKSEEGNTFGGDWSGLTDDAWLKIVAQGFEGVYDDEPVSEVEFYLVNGYNVVEDWQKWDLSGLGKVAKVRFNFLYSEEMGGRYGFTIPGYFAYDDVAVRFEK